MAMTLHRTEGRGDTLSVQRLLGDMYDLSPAIAQSLATFGKLGHTLALMIDEKRKIAARDKKAQEILDAKTALLKEIDEKTKPVMEAMKAALPKGTTIDLVSFQQLAQAMVCQAELAKIATLDAQLDVLAIQHKDQIIAHAIGNLMGKATNGARFPNANTVYVVENNISHGWRKIAFVVENDTSGARVFAENGDTYNEIAELIGIPISSRRFCQKVAYVIEGFPEGVTVAANKYAQMEENDNPFEGIRPKARAIVTDYALTDWTRANKVKL